MKLFKKAGLVFSIALVLAMALTSLIPQKSFAQTPEQIQAEASRQLLVNTRLCLEKSGTLDLGDDEFDANNDILSDFEVNGGDNDYEGNGNEVHVVGLLVDDDDGIMSCTQVIHRGINVLEGSGTIPTNTPSAVGAWLMQRLAGRNLTNNNNPFDPDQAAMERQLTALISEINTATAQYEAITRPVANELLRLRALPLLRQCYTISGTGGQGQVGDNGFEAAGGFFYPKSGRSEIVGTYSSGSLTLAPYLNTGGQNVTGRQREVYLGDVELGWVVDGNALVGSTFEFSSNFYPIGRDIPQTSGMDLGIVDCLFVRDNAQAILAGLAIQDDGSITMADGSPLTGALAAAAEPPEAASEADEPSCESEGGEGSWLLCPLLRGLDTGIANVDREIGQLLRVNGEYFNDESLRNAAVRIRNIAYILIIPILLFMVISTALGFGFVDAYTIKRALPRLLFAIIFATLSFDIVRIMVVATNGVGSGVAGIITQPFGGFNNIGLANIFNSGGDAADGLMLTSALLIGTASVAVLSLGVIISFLFVVFVGLLIGFVLLAFRQFLIIALAILAPMAILSWIFPGNDKLWKLWWGTFTKLLLLYPLVMILLSSGRVFAVLMDNVGETSISNTFIKLLAYVGPFFFIPAAFKFAGGIFGNIAGIANDRGRGLFDRQRKYRGKKMAHTWDQTKRGERFNERRGTAFLARRYNKVGGGIGLGAKGNFGLGEKGRQANAIRNSVLEAETLKNNPMLQQLGQNDDDGIAMLAASGGTSRGLSEGSADLQAHWIDTERREAARNGTTFDLAAARNSAAARAARAEAAAKAIGLNKSNARAAMVLTAQNKARSIQGPGAMGVITRAANRISDDNVQQAESIRQGFMYHARGNGRTDLGDTTMERSWTRQSIGAIVGGDARAMENFATQIEEDWTSGDTVRMQRAATWMAELQGAKPGATEANNAIINRTLQNLNYDPSRTIGLEDQLAERINERHTDLQRLANPGLVGPVPPITTGEQIFKNARKYSKDTTEAERQQYVEEQRLLQRRLGGGP